MKVLAEKAGDTGAGPRLAHLEQILQELTRCEELKRQQSVESASASTRQKLLSDQLLQTQEELAAAQLSRVKLCEEIGTLKQAKSHQAKQLDKYKIDMQTARESQAAMTKKVEELEASTWTAKQQYIRSLASRIKTSALVLQQLNTTNGTPFGAQLTEKCSESDQGNRNKRKRIRAEEEENRVVIGSSEPKHAGDAATIDHVPREDQTSESAPLVGAVTAPASTNAKALIEQHNASLNTSHDTKKDEQQDKHCAGNEQAAVELQSQIAQLKAKHSDLNDKYKALACEHNNVLSDRRIFAQELKAKESKIEELLQMLEISRSKEQENSAVKSTVNDEDSSALEGRLKLLEESLTQMNGYADQLEMVIAQCPSCTVKLQNESTQDSTANRAE